METLTVTNSNNVMTEAAVEAVAATKDRSKDWLLFIAGILFALAVWLLAKVLAWLIPSFRPIYNRIFVISVPTILTGGNI